MKILQSDHWQLRLPDESVIEEEEDSYLIFQPKGIGNLEITTSVMPADINMEDLEFFASEQLEAGLEPSAASAGDFSGIEFVYEHDELFVRDWIVYNGNLLVLATYSCEMGKEEKEEAMIEIILSTLRLNKAK